MAIKSFRRTQTQALFNGTRVRQFVNIETIAMRKLAMLQRAYPLDDLRIPPNNRLEALKGNLIPTLAAFCCMNFLNRLTSVNIDWRDPLACRSAALVKSSLVNVPSPLIPVYVYHTSLECPRHSGVVCNWITMQQ